MSSSEQVRTFVLDTSVLIADSSALTAFDEHERVISLVVINELEHLRRDPIVGYTARKVLRDLENLRTQPGADLQKGIVVNEFGGRLILETNHSDGAALPESMRSTSLDNDTRILSVAAALASAGREVTVVSRDLPMRLIAAGILGLRAEEYLRDQAPDDNYTGLIELHVPVETVDAMYRHGTADLPDLSLVTEVPVHTGIVLTSPSSSGLGRLTANKTVEAVADLDVFGVRGRSAAQKVALANLMDPDIHLVSLGGNAGSGKSILTIAAALEQILETHRYERMIVFRPLHAVGGETLGFLPGDQSSKLEPWADATWDALAAIASKNVIDEVRDRRLLEVLPITHLRGRQWSNCWLAIEEVQNLELNSIVTAITRAGHGTKVSLTGDVNQIDNRFVNKHSGVARVINTLLGEPLFSHTTLTKSERSPIAELATRLLTP